MIKNIFHKLFRLLNRFSKHHVNKDILKDFYADIIPQFMSDNLNALYSRSKTSSCDVKNISPHNQDLHKLVQKFPYYGIVPIQIGNHKFFMLSNNDDNVAKIFFHYGANSYESLSTFLFAAIAEKANCVFDVGAYTGVYALLAATANPDANIYAFEPIKHISDRVFENTQLNNFDNLVSVNSAISNSLGHSTLTLYGPNASTTGASLQVKPGKNDVGTINVDVTTMDEFITSNKIDRPNLIKIDTEKDEINALKGATEILTKNKPTILLEVLDQNSLVEITKYLDEFGYRFGLLDENSISVEYFQYGKNLVQLKGYANIFCYHETSTFEKELLDEIVVKLKV